MGSREFQGRTGLSALRTFPQSVAPTASQRVSQVQGPTSPVGRATAGGGGGNGRDETQFSLQMGKNVVYCQLSHLCEKYEFARWAHGRRKAHSGQAEKSPDLWHGPGGRAGTDRDPQARPGSLRHTAGDTVLVLGSGESGLVLSKPEVLDRVARQILEDMGRNEEK